MENPKFAAAAARLISALKGLNDSAFVPPTREQDAAGPGGNGAAQGLDDDHAEAYYGFEIEHAVETFEKSHADVVAALSAIFEAAGIGPSGYPHRHDNGLPQLHNAAALLCSAAAPSELIATQANDLVYEQ